MATYRQIVYMVLDEIKSLNGDSTITEEHVMFLANQYRLFLLEQKKKAEGDSALSESDEQTLCLTLEPADGIEGQDYCNDAYLRTVETVPDTVDGSKITVSFNDRFSIRTAFVTKERLKYVGYNPWLKNIIYIALADDKHLYFKSSNQQFLYLEEAKITGVFEDAEEAAKYSCEKNEDGSPCDILDQKFPLKGDLIPQLIELIVKELYGVQYRPNDDINNDKDDMADILQFVRQNMKSRYQKELQ